MSKWKTENHFASWLRLCPDNRISGNKVIGKGRLPTNNPINIALKMAASTLREAKPIWERSFVDCEPGWGLPSPSRSFWGAPASASRWLYEPETPFES